VDGGRMVNVLALASPETVLIWAYNPAVLPWSDGPVPAAPGFKGALQLRGCSAGNWGAEQWETASGARLSAQAIPAMEGTLTFQFQTVSPDIALKVVRLEQGPAGEATPELVLLPWDPAPAAGPRAQMVIPRLMSRVLVDGRLNEWPDLPTTVSPADGRTPEDNSFAFTVAHDAENLYVAVRVTDDHVVRRNAGKDLWKDDCVELWIDSRNSAGYFSNMPNDPGCYQINLAPSLTDGGPVDHIIYRHPSLNEQRLSAIEAASQTTATGYTLEARVPLPVLRGEATLKDSNRIGFNISTCDADPEGQETSWKHLLWQGKEEWDATQWAEGRLE
ncbi:MAG: hypothetical protein JXB13_04020, partial [Phycisphaerae bacterium]|nr:hypothetical protein [Phycisphaerae bacterium]